MVPLSCVNQQRRRSSGVDNGFGDDDDDIGNGEEDEMLPQYEMMVRRSQRITCYSVQLLIGWSQISDTFPYAGTTTTCALYTGVPCITTADSVHAHDVGVSLLTKVELGHLIAKNEDDYVELALKLASDS